MSCLKNLEFLDTKIVWGNFNQRGKHRSILGEVLGSRRFHHSPSPHHKPTQPMKLFPCCLLETLITCCFPKMFLKSKSPTSYYPFIFWLFWTSALKETQKNRTAVEHGKVSQQRRILKEIAQMISEQSIVFNFCITRKQKHSLFTSFFNESAWARKLSFLYLSFLLFLKLATTEYFETLCRMLYIRQLLSLALVTFLDRCWLIILCNSWHTSNTILALLSRKTPKIYCMMLCMR